MIAGSVTGTVPRFADGSTVVVDITTDAAIVLDDVVVVRSEQLDPAKATTTAIVDSLSLANAGDTRSVWPLDRTYGRQRGQGRQRDQTLLERPAQKGARSSRLRIFPEPVLGSSSDQLTDRGIL